MFFISSRLKKTFYPVHSFVSFLPAVREQDISVDGTCLNGEGRNTGAVNALCRIRSIGDEADFPVVVDA